VPRKRVSIEPQARRIGFHDEGDALRSEPIGQHLSAFTNPTKQWAFGDAGSAEPVPNGGDRTGD
jgi:hypothetical protein